MTPRPALISVAPNGAKRLKTDHPAIPLTPAELALDALACANAGAGLYHLHVRDEQGHHSLDPNRYRASIEAIEDAVGDRMILQITTEAVGIYDAAMQMEIVRTVKPRAASLALREFLPEGTSMIEVTAFLHDIAERGVLPQFILYTPQEAERLRLLIESGIVPFENPPVLFVIGRYDDGTPTGPSRILDFTAQWRADGHWSVCAFGAGEIAVAATALALGGHARVGFENNVVRADGVALCDNAEQVIRVATIARALQRPLTQSVPGQHIVLRGERIDVGAV
ncbi:3-keto-5-aminohexanoate cleavage protein [Sphingomonas sp. CGMCC 1.13654]|uniref:3-keto-5-aminohexanoate cleavage protein n=1 Tax=Sphingomonas chungangi TaxID=2683589 RepID=A0A838L4Z9_9SPHN|nr:3-keto-5-aminohexanoate cleavage protein [Sphingomonas chungangi]MBA2933970.1 3-keto-5-aminohexanoate cleavage protein [Sphingomonas chungangi]MVW57095.1 3-keto-5-aminohexanoate cleavage protein [Sphingomonas chungangi]